MEQVTRGIFHSISHEKSVALVACIHSTINWAPDSVPHMSRIECKYKKNQFLCFPLLAFDSAHAKYGVWTGPEYPAR